MWPLSSQDLGLLPSFIQSLLIESLSYATCCTRIEQKTRQARFLPPKDLTAECGGSSDGRPEVGPDSGRLRPVCGIREGLRGVGVGAEV